LQFLAALHRGLGTHHFEVIERIKDNPGNYQAGILLVVGWNDVPRRVVGARPIHAVFISLHVMVPIPSLVNVCKAELPVLFRFLNSFEKTFSLFVFRKVEEKLNNPRSIAIKVSLQIHDGAITVLPESFLAEQLLRQPLAAENRWMNPNDQHFLVIRTIEDPDPSAFRKTARGTPEKIMLQFFSARLFEAENLAAFWIYSGHNVPDGAILAGRVHPLENQKQSIAVRRVVKLLQ